MATVSPTLDSVYCDSSQSRKWTGCCCWIIALISIYDAYLVVYFKEFLDEQNPVCRFLIELEPAHLSLFLAGKAFGTLVVIMTIIGLEKLMPRLSRPVTYTVTAFQIGLLLFLHISDIHA